MKLGIGIPCPEYVNAAFAFDNLLGIIGKSKFVFDDVFVASQSGVRTDKNRNVILQRFIDARVDYVLWLDADMLYPHNITETYMNADFDIIGCLYFKRTHPFDPVAYIKNPKPTPDAPYMSLDPSKLPDNAIAEVDGLGYGGMMVKMDVYKGMGKDKWTYYDKNFHIPNPVGKQSTHDLVFCRNAQKHGFSIKLHTGVKPGHLSTQVITQSDWERAREE